MKWLYSLLLSSSLLAQDIERDANEWRTEVVQMYEVPLRRGLALKLRPHKPPKTEWDYAIYYFNRCNNSDIYECSFLLEDKEINVMVQDNEKYCLLNRIKEVKCYDKSRGRGF